MRKLRQGYVKDGIGYIPLTQGKWALVDAHNFHRISQFNWYAVFKASDELWYAQRMVSLPDGSKHAEHMHRVVMGVTDPEIQVDHIETEATLDNRRSNLRPATHAQNIFHQRRRRTNKSGFKGVSWNKRRARWVAQIKRDGKSKHLGYFLSSIDAAQAYNKAAKRLFGEFAVLNDPSN